MKIYTLKDPITNEIKYCGYTTVELRKRLWGHVAASKRNPSTNWAMKKWIKSLCDKNKRPIIEELDSSDDFQELLMLENYWIYQLKAWGFNLLNINSGGDEVKFFKGKRNREYSYIRIKVHRYDKEGVYICSYSSLEDAAKDVNVTSSAISRCLENLNYTPSSAGFYWSKEKVDKIDIIKPILGNTGKKKSEQEKKKARKRMLGYKWNKEALEKRTKSVQKPIKQMNEDGSIIKVWGSQKEVKDKLGIKLYKNRFGLDKKIRGFCWDFF